MRLLIIPLAALVFSCKEKLSEFVYENFKTTGLEKHIYKYDPLGRINVDKQVNYRLVNGVRVDSSLSSKSYQYTKTGKLKQVTDKSEYDEDRRIYFYDEKDSLTAEYLIRNDRDTILLRRLEYDDNGYRVSEILRWLHSRMAEAFDANDLKNPKYDTTYYKTINIFEGTKQVGSKTFDQNGKLTDEKVTIYDGLFSEIGKNYSFMDTIKFLNSQIHYDYSKSRRKPDYFIIDIQGDTTSFFKTFLNEKGEIFKSISSMSNDLVVLTFYDDRNLRIYEVNISKDSKWYFRFSNDERGNPIEVEDYREKTKSE